MNGDPVHKVDMHHYTGFFSDEVFYQQIPSEVKIMGEVFQVSGDLTYACSHDGKQLHVAAVPYIQCDREINIPSPVSDLSVRTLTYTSTSHEGRYPLVTYFYS